jgi:hypothetical protein
LLDAAAGPLAEATELAKFAHNFCVSDDVSDDAKDTPLPCASALQHATRTLAPTAATDTL